MDIRALAELVMMALMGLSVLAIAVGFSVRMFLAPTIKELIGRKYAADDDEGQARVRTRIEGIEDRLDSIESGINRLLATSEFDRELVAPTQAPELQAPELQAPERQASERQASAGE